MVNEGVKYGRCPCDPDLYQSHQLYDDLNVFFFPYVVGTYLLAEAHHPHSQPFPIPAVHTPYIGTYDAVDRSVQCVVRGSSFVPSSYVQYVKCELGTVTR